MIKDIKLMQKKSQLLNMQLNQREIRERKMGKH